MWKAYKIQIVSGEIYQKIKKKEFNVIRLDFLRFKCVVLNSHVSWNRDTLCPGLTKRRGENGKNNLYIWNNLWNLSQWDLCSYPTDWRVIDRNCGIVFAKWPSNTYSRFKLPLNLHEHSISGLKMNRKETNFMRNAKLIICEMKLDRDFGRVY